MKVIFRVLFICLIGYQSHAGTTIKVLFIGDSYTSVNDLPTTVQSVAQSTGDNLIYTAITPGGSTLGDHWNDASVHTAIMQGGWDYVVLQEQSEYPAFPINQVTAEVFPYAKSLDSLVGVYNPCAKTVFYMTWGHENGDPPNCPQWPPVCTYEGMDSLLQLRYFMMADSNQAWLSPVGKVWHNLRDNNPAINLYASDSIHPSVAGTFAAALSFYTIFYGKDPSLTTYNSTLTIANADTIRAAAHTVVFDSLNFWRQFSPALSAGFTFTSTNKTCNFTSVLQITNVSYSWNFGDGSMVATTQNASHAYAANGTYNVCLTVKNVCDSATTCQTISVGTTGINSVNTLSSVTIYPNPAKDFIQVQNLSATCSYQIYNAVGLQLNSGKLDSQHNTVNLNNYAKGLYYLKIWNAAHEYTIAKVVKE